MRDFVGEVYLQSSTNLGQYWVGCYSMVGDQ